MEKFLDQPRRVTTTSKKLNSRTHGHLMPWTCTWVYIHIVTFSYLSWLLHVCENSGAKKKKQKASCIVVTVSGWRFHMNMIPAILFFSQLHLTGNIKSPHHKYFLQIQDIFPFVILWSPSFTVHPKPPCILAQRRAQHSAYPQESMEM